MPATSLPLTPADLTVEACYGFADALADGRLQEVTHLAADFGWRCRVALTTDLVAALRNQAVENADESLPAFTRYTAALLQAAAVAVAHLAAGESTHGSGRFAIVAHPRPLRVTVRVDGVAGLVAVIGDAEVVLPFQH